MLPFHVMCGRQGSVNPLVPLPMLQQTGLYSQQPWHGPGHWQLTPSSLPTGGAMPHLHSGSAGGVPSAGMVPLAPAATASPQWAVSYPSHPQWVPNYFMGVHGMAAQAPQLWCPWPPADTVERSMQARAVPDQFFSVNAEAVAAAPAPSTFPHCESASGVYEMSYFAETARAARENSADFTRFGRGNLCRG